MRKSAAKLQYLAITGLAQPHRPSTVKRSRDPGFAAKLIDIVGFYVDPLTHAVVLYTLFAALSVLDGTVISSADVGGTIT